MPSFDTGDGVDGYSVAIGCHRVALPRKTVARGDGKVVADGLHPAYGLGRAAD